MEEVVHIVCGPTAVGKSAYALALAKARNGEIVNADSQQVYRGCDIGTGKLSLAQREGIPHHCLDLVHPDQPFNAAQFVAAADAAITDISARGKTPIIVGGTGLYLKALVYGLCDAPPTDPQFRAACLQVAQEQGTETLHQQLRAVDLEAAARIHPRQTSRIIRALDVFRQTGRSMVAIQSDHAFRTPRYKVEWHPLTVPRNELYERINARVERMIADGWVDEVARLMQQHNASAPALRAIGYRELVHHRQTGDDFAATVSRIQQNTRRFAKRQMTWFALSRI